MDHKTWLWRKKSTEKIILATDKLTMSSKDNQEDQTPMAEKGELDNELKSLNDKLSSALSECNIKDNLVKKNEKMAKEAVAEMEKEKAEAVSLKQELNEALQQKIVSDERLTQLDAALKECMQQLQFVREEQEHRIHDVMAKASNDFEKSRGILEEQLGETSKRLMKLGSENTNLTKALLAKEKVIDDLNKQKAQLETELNALMARLESTDKDNSSLKYEIRVLEKELEIRNEEREFNRRTAEASQKQHLESVKKIAKLESECQRLRILVRKRLPGPAALAKMKNEVEILGREPVEMRRRTLSPLSTGQGLDPAVDNYSVSPNKRTNILTEQLNAMEEENKALKEALNKKSNELQFSRAMYARTASKLSEVESRLEESPKTQVNIEATRNSVMPHEISLASMSDVGSDDKASCAESWASALLSELESFRNGQLRKSPSSRKTVESLEMNLMDDFVEMEKLALVSVDKPSESTHLASDEASGTIRTGNSSEVCKEIVLVPDNQSDHSLLNNDMMSKSSVLSKFPGWLQDILKLIMEENCATERNPGEILEDIRKAVACTVNPNTGEFFLQREGSYRPNSSNPSCISGYISWKYSNDALNLDSSHESTDTNISLEQKRNQQYQPVFNKSICRIIELIEGINLFSPDYNMQETLYKQSETPSSYMVRVFQWKSSELSAILQQFLHACYDLLNGKTDINTFTQELTSALDWIMNHCFSLQDVSSMKDAIKKQCDWYESRSESEAEVGVVGQFTEVELSKKYLVDKLYSSTNSSDSPMNQPAGSKKTITKLQAELEALRKAGEMDEGQLEKQNLAKDKNDKQLSPTNGEINEASLDFPSQDKQPENKNNCNEELKATYSDSVTEKEISNSELKQEGNHLRTNWEITAASEKLAECQETILNLGKQLKALATPKEASLFDNVISTPTDTVSPTSTSIPTPTKKKLISQRSSLLDQMIAEDNLESPKAKENGNASSGFISTEMKQPMQNIVVPSENHKQQEDNGATKSLAIVPSKKQGVSLWKRLLRRKTKSSSKKTALPFAP